MPKAAHKKVISPKTEVDLDSMIQIIARIGNEIALLLDLDELLETTVQRVRERLGYEQVVVSLLEDSADRFSRSIAAGPDRQVIFRYSEPDAATGPAYRAANEKKVIISNDPQPEAGEGAPAIESALHLPLIDSGSTLGVLTLGAVAPDAFSEQPRVTALQLLGAQLAAAITQACDYNQKAATEAGDHASQKINSHVAQMHHIVPQVQPLGGSIRNVFDNIVRGVVEAMDYTGAVVAVVNNKDKTLPVRALAYSHFTDRQNWNRIEQMLGVQIIGKSVSLEEHPQNLAVQSCQSGTAKFSHNLYDLFTPLVTERMAAYIQVNTRIKTCVAIPLTANNKVVGTLCAGTEKARISAADLDTLHFFAAHAAIAIQNSLYVDRVNRDLAMREAELAQLRRIERMINYSLKLEDVLKHILDGALELTNADFGQVVLVDTYAAGLVQRVTFPDILDASWFEPDGLSELIHTKPLPRLSQVSALIRNNGHTANGKGKNGRKKEPRPGSKLSVPISFEEELVGVISIGSAQTGALSDRAREMLEQIAVQAAIAIRNAYQFKTQQDIRERLANVSQVVAMGDMAGNMVHRINNWVGSIRADINYLLRFHGDKRLKEHEYIELYQEMLTNAEATLAMAENIKKPFQHLEQEAVHVNHCIARVLEDKQSALENVTLIEEFGDIPLVLATRQLELVFENLINNSLQAMEGVDNAVLHCISRLAPDGQWVEVAIRDNGPGLPGNMDPADIFKLGVSGRRSGMGYGLWWSDTFLKRWGGQIEYLEDTDHGCEFLVRLPVMEQSAS
jgi:GAF domain-containing protein